LNLLKSKNS